MEKSRRGHSGRLTLAASVLLACAPALADPAIPGQPNTALHVGKRALDQVGALALQKLPSHIEIPSIDKNLLNACPQAPIALQIRQGYVDLVPTSLEFQTKNGALAVNAMLDLSGFAQVTIARGYACLDDAQCDVSFSATALNPKATMSLSVTKGMPQASIGDTTITSDLHVEFHNCIADKIPQSIVDGLANKLLEMSQGLIGDQLRSIVPPMIETQIKAMSTVSGNQSGYGFAATLTDLQMTDTGINAYAEVGVDYEGTAAACIPADAPMGDRNPTLVGSAMSLPSDDKSSVVVGVSTDLVSSAIAAAWRSGLMCMDDLSLTTLGFDPSQLGNLVPGLPLGLQLKFYVTMAEPPTVETDNTTNALRMRVKGAALHLTMSVPDKPDSTATLSTDFTVAIKPDVDPLSGTIFASLGDMSMERLELHADSADATYAVDPERMTVLVRDVVVPMAAAKLKTMPLSPASFNVAGFYAWLNNVSVRNSAFYAGVDAYMPGPASDDMDAPTTTMDGHPGALVRAGMVRYQVSGTDDVTPSQLLRYEWQLDNKPIAPPSFARIIEVPVLEAGEHTVRIRAVDLTGKGASTWKTHTFVMDLVAPTLTVLEQPEVSARVTSAKIRFTGSDDQSDTALLSYAYRLSSKAPGGETQFVREVQPTGMVNGEAELEIGDLSSGTVYEATLMLYDEAGNVTSKKVGFAAAPTGCSVGGAPSASWFSLFLVVASLLVIKSRRRVTAR